MSKIFPFSAVMPPADKAKIVADPPYDVVSREEAAVLAAGNPLGFMRVARAEIELPGVDAHSDEVYEQAKKNYRRLCAEVPLVADEKASFYVYSLVMDGHRQTGVVAAAAVDDYDAEIIKKHEKTRQDKEDDRTRHILTLRSQTGPVFLTYRDSSAVNAIVERTVATEPLFDFVADDGVQHTGWRIAAADTESLAAAFFAIPNLYIADGHHRAASASRTRATLRENGEAPQGDEECNGFLAVIFPETQLRILPYNRVVLSLNGLTEESLRAKIATNGFSIEPTDSPVPECSGTIHMFLENSWWKLTFKGETKDLPPAARLDVSLLQDNILAPLLGIDDPRTSEDIEFVGGIRGTQELEKRVAAGAAVAFSMFPTTVSQLMDISDAGEIMPPKSTWFEPKLRDGLFVHDI